jgi:hypothetical protein
MMIHLSISIDGTEWLDKIWGLTEAGEKLLDIAGHKIPSSCQLGGNTSAP